MLIPPLSIFTYLSIKDHRAKTSPNAQPVVTPSPDSSSSHIENPTEGAESAMKKYLWRVRITPEMLNVLYRLFFAFVGVSIIVFVEKTIIINQIDMSGAPVTNPGQLIPLIVGILSSTSTYWAVYKQYQPRRLEYLLAKERAEDEEDAFRYQKLRIALE
ncbi:hypothetical protein B0J14DRAFT_578048 [Halenospora varia]|nr:hypothetical protein B0J14DRAFT_578048 [Halenospora varia]